MTEPLSEARRTQIWRDANNLDWQKRHIGELDAEITRLRAQLANRDEQLRNAGEALAKVEEQRDRWRKQAEEWNEEQARTEDERDEVLANVVAMRERLLECREELTGNPYRCNHPAEDGSDDCGDVEDCFVHNLLRIVDAALASDAGANLLAELTEALAERD